MPKKFKDSDNDGLSDFDEINYFGSDPYNADSDGDGIEDGEAVLNGKDPVGGQPLKDFFIPHAGNNYQPKSLHPKRLLFHAISALAIKSLIIALVFFYPLTAWMTPDLLMAEGAKIIALTNKLRQSLSLPPLKENAKLGQAAYKKVEDMLIGQYFAHVSPRGLDLEYFLKLAAYKDYVSVGENLAMGYDNAAEVIEAWKNSPTHYSNLTDRNFSEIGVALAGGDYLDSQTVFSAQYFGFPDEKGAVITKTKKPILKTSASKPKAKITIDKAAGAKKEQIVKVEAALPASTTAASLEILNTKIEMAPLANEALASTTEWTGQTIIDNAQKPLTPPILTIDTGSGESENIEINSTDIKPQETSVASQYWLFKNHPNKSLKQIFDISSLYFKILLGLVILASILNIFINIRKQHPKLIFSSLGLIALLVIMIIF